MPGRKGWIIASTLFTIPEGVNISKLEAKEGIDYPNHKFKLFAKVVDDDTFKPGEYMEVSFYKDVHFGKHGTCHYKFVHSFLVYNPIKFWHLKGYEKIADWYDILLTGSNKVYFIYSAPSKDGSDVSRLKLAFIDLKMIVEDPIGLRQKVN